MKIDGYISELLYDHDCVIVMDLGGIIAHYHPASINKALHVISPPSKRLAFNGSLKNNDGLLAHHISGKEALNYADACQVIKDYVEHAKSQMAEGKKVKIEKVGVLFFDKDKNLQFLPDQHANYLIDSFGLSPVHAPIIKRDVPVNETVEMVHEVAQNASQIKHPHEIRIFKWKVLEVIPAAAVLTFLLMVPPVLNRLNTNMGTLLPFSRMNEYVNQIKGVEPNYKPYSIEYTSPFDIPPARMNSNDVPATSENIPAEISPESTVKNEVPVTTETPVTIAEPIPVENSVAEIKSTNFSANSSLAYHIIGGSFRSFENAEKLVVELKTKNIDAAIIGQNKAGLYLVSLLSSDNFTQVTDALTEVKSSTVPTAWVYKK